MTRKYYASILGALVVLVSVLTPVALAADSGAKVKDCDLTYTLKGWSAVYKTAKGQGTITCTNGQTANVTIDVKGGGATFGKTEIFNGKGEISGVRSIDEIYGSYVSASAHAGVVKAGDVEAMTKGNVSLALAGSGGGVDVGIDFSKFQISKAGEEKHKK